MEREINRDVGKLSQSLVNYLLVVIHDNNYTKRGGEIKGRRKVKFSERVRSGDKYGELEKLKLPSKLVNLAKRTVYCHESHQIVLYFHCSINFGCYDPVPFCLTLQYSLPFLVTLASLLRIDNIQYVVGITFFI